MKLVACSDLHFVDNNPKRRIDNYSETLFDKWIYILNYAIDHNIDVVAIAGDIFDTHKASNQLIANLIKSFNILHGGDPEYDVLAVLGQHDLAFRSENNSPMQILNAAKIVKIINHNGFIVSDRPKNVCFYGCGWDEEIPKPKLGRGANFNILVIHKMISNKDYWHGNVQYTEALSFLKEQEDYDLIISGDNHNTFCVEYKDRLLINPGSLGRRNIDQVDHKPCFFVYDTDTRTYYRILIPISPIEEVFDFNVIEKEKIDDRKKEEIEKFINSLPKYLPRISQTQPMDYISKILARIKNLPEDYNSETIEIIYECLDGLKISQEE